MISKHFNKKNTTHTHIHLVKKNYNNIKWQRNLHTQITKKNYDACCRRTQLNFGSESTTDRLKMDRHITVSMMCQSEYALRAYKRERGEKCCSLWRKILLTKRQYKYSEFFIAQEYEEKKKTVKYCSLWRKRLHQRTIQKNPSFHRPRKRKKIRQWCYLIGGR